MVPTHVPVPRFFFLLPSPLFPFSPLFLPLFYKLVPPDYLVFFLIDNFLAARSTVLLVSFPCELPDFVGIRYTPVMCLFAFLRLRLFFHLFFSPLFGCRFALIPFCSCVHRTLQDRLFVNYKGLYCHVSPFHRKFLSCGLRFMVSLW